MSVRFATPAEDPLVFSFIQRKPEFDQRIAACSGVLQVSEDKLYKTLFGEPPFAYILFVEQFRPAIGFALYHFRYASFAGQPSIWLITFMSKKL